MWHVILLMGSHHFFQRSGDRSIHMDGTERQENLPETLKGYVEHFIYRNEENGYSVFVLISGGKEITCVGNCRDLEAGESAELQGEYVQNPSYGRQFKIQSYRVVPPADAESMERYLGSGAVKGVGQALAARIVAKFGADTFRIIEDEPERLAEIKGISNRKAMEIAIQLEEKRDLRDAMVFLAGYHISQALSVKIFEEYGTDVYDVLKENPYRLAEDISGVGFQTADRIAAEMGMRPDSEFRIRCGITYALQQSATEGHCYLPAEELGQRASELLGVPAEDVLRETDALLIDRRIIIRDGNVYLPVFYYAEVNSARLLKECNLELKHLTPAEETRLVTQLEGLAASLEMELDPLQIEAVKECVCNGVFVLSGGPGTGKTTTINLIIRYFLQQGMDLLLAAPTGRAAKRMTEATGFEAKTIHRLLEVGGGMDGGRPVFQRNEDAPLEADVVIIDEMSMVDILLFHALMKAIVPGTRLILVGDVDQLPSVSPGQVLRDILESGCYPGIRLEKIFRQAMDSDIVVNAHRINHGEQIRLDTASRDFLFLERNDESVIRQHMVWMIREKLPEYCKCSTGEIQVLTPMRKGTLGCVELNRFLQGELNPPDRFKREHAVGDMIFREGDKVMQIRNNYKLEWNVYGAYRIPVDSGVGVFNGDMGRIKEIDEAGGGLTVVFEDGREVDYPMNGLDELELAYAVTIHKSQGSEYPAVVMPILDPPRMLQYRNLLYTGITRARNCLVLLGSSAVIRGMIDNEGENRRYSSFRKQITEMEAL